MICQLRRTSCLYATRAIGTKTPPGPQKLKPYQETLLCAAIGGGLSYLFCYTLDYQINKQTNKRFLGMIAESQDLTKIRNKDCIVYFEACNDHNGAMEESRRSTNLAQPGITPIVRRVHNVREIPDTLNILQKQNNRIHSLILSAHGSPTGIAFDDQLKAPFVPPIDSWIPSFIKSFMWDPEDGWVKAIRKLDAGTIVILISCSTAQELDGQPSIARKISSYNPKIRVIAPTETLPPLFTTIQFTATRTEKDRLSLQAKVRFRSSSMRDITTAFQGGECIQKPPRHLRDDIADYCKQFFKSAS